MTQSTTDKLERAGALLKEFFFIIGFAVFLIVLIHYAIGGARSIKHHLLGVKSTKDMIEESKKSPIFKDDNVEAYFAESNSPNMHFQVFPYYHWRKAPFEGKAINVDSESNRVTIKATPPLPNAKKVFMFGGSALWGTGSSDKYTIPSQLQTLLGPTYDVTNFGENAFVSVQELNVLLEQLAKGAKPDIVIFYDGPIDIYTGLYSPGKPRHPQFSAEDYTSKSDTSYLLLKLLEKTNYIAITERIKKLRKKDPLSEWEASVLPNLESNAMQTIESYQHLMKQVKALGRAYGFKVYHIWQPILLTEKKPKTADEQAIVAATSIPLVKSYEIAEKIVKDKLSKEDNFIYMADIFNNVKEPIYFDFCHVGPKGNQIIAQKIHDEIFTGGENLY